MEVPYPATFNPVTRATRPLAELIVADVSCADKDVGKNTVNTRLNRIVAAQEPIVIRCDATGDGFCTGADLIKQKYVYLCFSVSIDKIL